MLKRIFFLLALLLAPTFAAAQGVTVNQLNPAVAPLPTNTAFWCGYGSPAHTYGCTLSQILQTAGNVQGPSQSVVGDVACWGNKVGTQLTDCGPRTVNFATFYAPGAGPCSSAAADEAAELAAYNYMVASGGAYIYVPPGFCYQAIQLLIANKSGWIADPLTVMFTQVKATGSSTPTSMVALDNAYDTTWVLSGIILNGGYDGTQSAWLDTQTGLNLTNAFNGINDAQYIANSPIGYQGPRGVVENVILASSSPAPC